MDNLLPLLEKAIRLAVNAHAGQLDKAGIPYILHPLRVMQAGSTVEEKIVGILHDVLEDTSITEEFLMNEGFPRYIVEAVLSVTKISKEAYEDFIKRCSKNEIGREVKIKDMRDNSDLFRLRDIEEHHIKMIRKYHWGMKILRESKVYIP
jgi:(p)ppGpp synthase/HD superfamily hydrolase